MYTAAETVVREQVVMEGNTGRSGGCICECDPPEALGVWHLAERPSGGSSFVLHAFVFLGDKGFLGSMWAFFGFEPLTAQAGSSACSSFGRGTLDRMIDGSESF